MPGTRHATRGICGGCRRDGNTPAGGILVNIAGDGAAARIGQQTADRSHCRAFFRLRDVDLRRAQNRCVIGAVDRDVKGGAADVIATVRHRVVEVLNHMFPATQRLHGGVAVVENVAVAAIGMEGQAAIAASQGVANGARRARPCGVAEAHGRDGLAVVAVGIGIVGQ